jgi:hypothetical protein
MSAVNNSPLTQAKFPPEKHGRFLLRRILSHRFGGVALLYFLFLSLALLTRMTLMAHSWRDVNAAPWILQGTFLCGLGFDLAAASAASVPLLLYLTLVPCRLFAHPAHRAFLSVAFFLGLYVLLFAAIAEWFFWDEFGARFNFIAVDYLVYTHEVIGIFASPIRCH